MHAINPPIIQFKNQLNVHGGGAFRLLYKTKQTIIHKIGIQRLTAEQLPLLLMKSFVCLERNG